MLFLDGYLTAVLASDETGIGNRTVFVAQRGRLLTGPVVEVSNVREGYSGDDTFALDFSGHVYGEAACTSSEIADAIRWMLLNRAAIEDYWNDRLGTRELLDRLRPID